MGAVGDKPKLRQQTKRLRVVHPSFTSKSPTKKPQCVEATSPLRPTQVGGKGFRTFVSKTRPLPPPEIKPNQVKQSKPTGKDVAPLPKVIPNVLPTPAPQVKLTKPKEKDDSPIPNVIPTPLANVHVLDHDKLQAKRSALAAMQLQMQAQTRTQIQARVPTSTTAQTRVQAIAPTQTRVQTQPRVQTSTRVQAQARARAPAHSQKHTYSEVVSHPDLVKLIYEGFSSTNAKRPMTCTLE